MNIPLYNYRIIENVTDFLSLLKISKMVSFCEEMRFLLECSMRIMKKGSVQKRNFYYNVRVFYLSIYLWVMIFSDNKMKTSKVDLLDFAVAQIH